MIKHILLFLLLTIITGCSKPKPIKEECCPEQTLDSFLLFSTPHKSLEDSSIFMISKSLDKSINTEKKIEKIKKTNLNLNKENTILQKTNTELNSELKVVKDSLIEVKIQLKETLSKIPKKRNIFQKFLGIDGDSVEIKQIDTIKN